MDRLQRFRDDHSDLLRKPMVGDDGVNPFAEPEAASEKADDNVYAAPGDAKSGPMYRPHGYVATLMPRSGRAAAMAVAGIVISLLTLGVPFVSSLQAPYGLAFSLANLALTVGGCVIGRNELKAIDAGVVVGSNRGQARLGVILGVIGTAITLGSAGLYLCVRVFELV